MCVITARTSRTLDKRNENQTQKKSGEKSNMCVITARTSRTFDKRNENQNSVISQQISSRDWKLESYVAYRHGLRKSQGKNQKKSNMYVITARTSQTLYKRNENQNYVLSQQISSQDLKLKSFMVYKADHTDEGKMFF